MLLKGYKLIKKGHEGGRRKSRKNKLFGRVSYLRDIAFTLELPYLTVTLMYSLFII